MSMNVTYWLNCEDKDRCFQIRRRGTVFEKEPAYITAYEVCKGLNEYYSNGKKNIPLRDAQTGKRFHDLPLTATVDKMIKWLREKHDIFYSPAMNLCIPLEDPLSMRVKRFWEAEDARQKQIEEYCKNDLACNLSLKKLYNQYVVHHEDTNIAPADVTRLPAPMEIIEELWMAVSDEPVPEIKTTTDQLKFYNKVLRTVAKQKNELRTLREDFDSLNKSYDRLWVDKERKKRMLNSFYGVTCGATADAYDEIQRLKKERDELKERLEKLEGGGYVCTVCKGRVCDQFIDILNALGIKEGALYPTRGQSKVDAYAKAAKVRAEVIFSEHQKMQKQIDELNERVRNQEIVIKAEGKSLTEHRKQIHDLGASLRDIKEVVDGKMDDLMKTHGAEEGTLLWCIKELDDIYNHSHRMGSRAMIVDEGPDLKDQILKVLCSLMDIYEEEE